MKQFLRSSGSIRDPFNSVSNFLKLNSSLSSSFTLKASSSEISSFSDCYFCSIFLMSAWLFMAIPRVFFVDSSTRSFVPWVDCDFSWFSLLRDLLFRCFLQESLLVFKLLAGLCCHNLLHRSINNLDYILLHFSFWLHCRKYVSLHHFEFTPKVIASRIYFLYCFQSWIYFLSLLQMTLNHIKH